jgi:hypothetical protein
VGCILVGRGIRGRESGGVAGETGKGLGCWGELLAGSRKALRFTAGGRNLCGAAVSYGSRRFRVDGVVGGGVI